MKQKTDEFAPSLEPEEKKTPSVEAAFFARALLLRSYCPHSGYPVSCVLVSHSGEMFYGVNVESDSYGLTMCAERNAVANALANTKGSPIVAVYIATKSGPGPVPCGACRQVLNEHFPSATVYTISGTSEPECVGTVEDLLPSAFFLRGA